MGVGTDLREGWRLTKPYAAEVVTPSGRGILVAVMVVLGVGGSALVHALAFEGEGAAGVLESLAVGIALVSVVVWVLLLLWRPRIADAQRYATSGVADPEAEREIRRAYAEGRDPAVPLSARFEAAARAETARLGLPRVIVSFSNVVGIVVAYVLFGVGVVIGSDGELIGVFGGAVGSVVGVVQFVTFVVTLGRTVPAIATRPEGEAPIPVEKGGKRGSSRPYRTLGTDHPDDYA